MRDARELLRDWWRELEASDVDFDCGKLGGLYLKPDEWREIVAALAQPEQGVKCTFSGTVPPPDICMCDEEVDACTCGEVKTAPPAPRTVVAVMVGTFNTQRDDDVEPTDYTKIILRGDYSDDLPLTVMPQKGEGK